MPYPTPASRGQTIDRYRQYCRSNTYLAGKLPATHADILVCLTLYNEPASALADTLAGLVGNQLQLASPAAAHPAKIIICILLDGIATADASTVDFLQAIGLDPRHPAGAAASFAQNHLVLQGRDIPADRLLAHCGRASRPEAPQRALPVSVVLASKRDNVGKLDSHAWFFWGVGQHIRSEFALQIDAASVTEAGCLPQLLDHMRREPECAAVTTRIQIPPPDSFNPQQNWQYADFLWEKVSDWAVGNALRYLEVVPGQCSLIRRRRFCCSDDASPAPLDVYLRGLQPHGLLERNLFLAEDRVLGFELVRRNGGNSVRYAADAVVRTDAAPTFAELVRQRRRWINSTIAARLHSLNQLPGVLANVSIPLPRRAGILLSLSWGFLQLAAQFFMPTFIAFMLAAGIFSGTADGQWPDAPQPLSGFCAAGAFLLLWSGILAASCRIGVNTRIGNGCHILLMSLMAALIYLALALSLMAISRQSAILLAIALILLGLSICLQSWRHLRQVARWLPLYLLLLPVFSLYLTTYSIANISDVSWGTKGLTASVMDHATLKRWSRQRNILLWGWIVGCAGLTALLLTSVDAQRWMFATQCISAFFFVRVATSAAISALSHIYRRTAAGEPARSATGGGQPRAIEVNAGPSSSQRDSSAPLPIARPTFPPFDTFADQLAGCLSSGIVTNGGPRVRQLEARLTEYLSVPGLAFCNGEQALIALLMAAPVRGKEVILPSFTFAGSAHAVVMAGARPVFADIASLDCPLLDIADAERRITAATAAILAVDVYGYASDYAGLEQLARRHRLRLFIDSAPAFGTTFRGRRIGGFGDGQIFSFHATKPYNTLEGGCVCSHDTGLLERAAAIRNFGQDSSGDCHEVGFNGKMSELNAIIGLAQLPLLESHLHCRRRAAARLIRGLKDIPGLLPCLPADDQQPVWQYLPLRVDAGRYGMNRDELQQAMQQAGVLVRRYYSPACHTMPAYAAFAGDRLQRTEQLAASVLALPIYNDMSDQECERILTILRNLHIPLVGALTPEEKYL